MERVLLVEDNKKVQFFNGKMLSEHGYEVASAMTLSRARELLVTFNPHIIVLDIGMPDGSGLDLLREIRKHSQVPVIMLTGFAEEVQVLEGFDVGCDDYMGKPYSFEVLLARIKRILKTSRRMDVITKGKLELNTMSRQAFVDEVALLLTPRDFALLQFFAQNEGVELSADHIFQNVWGQPMLEDTKALINAISRLRKKLEKSDYSIKTIYGKGYIFEMN